jgi:hypothetical protein
MFNKTRAFVPTAIVLFGFLGMPAAFAQSQPCYTLASLQGSYAVIGTYGANVAIAFGTRSADGQGNLTGSFVLNEPKAGSTTGERTIVTGTQKGTYTVNCDGTGVITRVLTLANGTTATGVDDFVITGGVVTWWGVIATALVDAQRTPSTIVPGGIFLTRTSTRLPGPIR